jgi:hypothetical protein
MIHHAVWYILTVISEDAVHSSEMLVNIYQTTKETSQKTEIFILLAVKT